METANESTPKPLSDDQLDAISPPLLTLVLRLEGVAERAPDPSVSSLASALAEYFRTPDAL